MIHYDNGCHRSEIKVTPANWNTGRASIKKNWKIYYRYYDPSTKGTELWGKMIQIRGMNDEKYLVGRQATTKFLINQEKEKLDTQGYNPITGQFYTAPGSSATIEEITPSTPFIAALEKASKMVTCGEKMLSGIEGIIRGMNESAGKLYDKTWQKPYISLKISQVSRKHILYIFQQRKKDSSRFSAYRQNKYRTALMMLYKVLVTLEAVDSNIIKDIPINGDYAHAKREVLSNSEQLIIDTNLKAWDYPFWRYMRIFFRSGSRSTELAQLKKGGGKNDGKVDLEKQEFTVLIKKRKKWLWETRPITDDVFHLWQEVWEGTGHGDYLFGSGIKPGPRKMGSGNPTKKWEKYVKNPPGKFDPFGRGWGLGINKDFYSLKHLNMDKIDEKEGIELAADAAGHGDTKMAKKHYAVGHEKRQREKLKKTKVDFAVKDQNN
jgi:hypothetical protein